MAVFFNYLHTLTLFFLLLLLWLSIPFWGQFQVTSKMERFGVLAFLSWKLLENFVNIKKKKKNSKEC